MGKLEQYVKIRTRKTKITNAILITLFVGVAGMLNPQALVRAALKELKVPKDKRQYSQNAIYVARKRLMKRGLIKYEDGYWRITDDGKKIVEEIKISSTGLPKPKRWDKKWRILIFDIREEKKGLREKVRNTLVSLGFKRLQDSVWVYPYDCEDFVALLKADFKIGRDLLYIIADTIENDVRLMKEFGLI